MSACQHINMSACQHSSMSACQHGSMSAQQPVSTAVCQHVSMSACPRVSKIGTDLTLSLSLIKIEFFLINIVSKSTFLFFSVEPNEIRQHGSIG